MAGFKFQKAVQVLNYLAIKEGGTINKMKALKLFWLSDRYHLRRHARTIVDDTYFAMKWGPVASGVKDLAEANNLFLDDDLIAYRNSFIFAIDQYKYKSVGAFDEDSISETDKEALDQVYQYYGKQKQFELSDISHSFPEWYRFEGQINKWNSRFEMYFSDFFKKPKGNFPLFDESEELVKINSEIFSENSLLSGMPVV